MAAKFWIPITVESNIEIQDIPNFPNLKSKMFVNVDYLKIPESIYNMIFDELSKLFPNSNVDNIERLILEASNIVWNNGIGTGKLGYVLDMEIIEYWFVDANRRSNLKTDFKNTANDYSYSKYKKIKLDKTIL